MLPNLEDSNNIRGSHPQKTCIHSKRNKYIAKKSTKKTNVEERVEFFSLGRSVTKLEDHILVTSESFEGREVILLDDLGQEQGYQIEMYFF